jgi:hypothetical protein
MGWVQQGCNWFPVPAGHSMLVAGIKKGVDVVAHRLAVKKHQEQQYQQAVAGGFASAAIACPASIFETDSRYL